MSMLSSECDGLRNAADELQNLIDNGYNYTWPGIVNTLHYAQQGLRSAADTIWELRNKLAGTVDQREEIERLEDENAKLRELVCDMGQTILNDDGCDWNIDANCCTSDECNVSCKYWYRMKKLGIEVNDDD